MVRLCGFNHLALDDKLGRVKWIDVHPVTGKSEVVLLDSTARSPVPVKPSSLKPSSPSPTVFQPHLAAKPVKASYETV